LNKGLLKIACSSGLAEAEAAAVTPPPTKARAIKPQTTMAAMIPPARPPMRAKRGKHAPPLV